MVVVYLVLLAAAAGGGAAAAQGANAQAIQKHYSLAQEALSQKRYDDAAEEFRKMLELNPKLAEAHANLGSIYYLRGDYLQASDAFREALKWKSSLARAEMFLGMSETRRGLATEALPHLAKGFWNSTGHDEWHLQAGLMLVELYHGASDLDKALDVVRALERSYSASQDVLYAAYRLHSDMGSRAVASLVKSAPGSARLHQLTAELHESEGNYPRAIEEYRTALKINPRLAGAHRALGVALMNNAPDNAARDEARRHFEQELALNPIDAHSEYQLGEICWRENRSEEALKHFSRAVELYPNFTDALIAVGKVWTAQGEPERAVEFIQRAVKVDPENEVAHYRLALAYQKMGLTQLAAEERAQFRKLRAAMESIRSIYKQLQGERITAQTTEADP